ncbi:hypothetical protein B9Z19DRAFT_527539 [Tuber borchii]|uniref:Uncharacterized protein n=1 Tax=Tuber borchii TaxID=42251 RepID=A0A2T6ZDP2_TUBBO|nr:hypothetical protein B9Z19DRAFT_527539 [Tuber borchii]
MAVSFFIAIPFLHFHGPPIGGGRCHVAHDGRQARKLARSRSVALFNPILFLGWASYHGVFGFVYLYKMFSSTCMYFTYLISSLLAIRRMVVSFSGVG